MPSSFTKEPALRTKTMAILSLRAIPSSSIAPYFLAAPSFTAASQALAIVWQFALPDSSIIGASIPCLCSHSGKSGKENPPESK